MGILCYRYGSLCVEFSEKLESFSINMDQTNFFIATVYANYSHVIRRQLLNELTNLQHANPDPWCLISDFNVVIMDLCACWYEECNNTFT